MLFRSPGVSAAGEAFGDTEPAPNRVPRAIKLVGIDTPGDPAAAGSLSGDSPTESSGPFDATRSDLGEDDDLSTAERARRRSRRRSPERIKQADEALGKLADPLAGTPPVKPQATGQDAGSIMAKMLKPRSDSWADWTAPLEPLHRCGEPQIGRAHV